MALFVKIDYQFSKAKKRPRIHAKTKSSNNKNSKMYVKTYRAQGK